MRLMAYVAGFGGGRERGIQMLQETAAHGRENRTDAMFALVLVYNREHRYDDALKVLQELRVMHPRNRLVLLEAGSTALRAGRAAEADAVLTEGLAMLAATNGAKIPGEEALWRYKRGAARVALGRPETARADLLNATSADGTGVGARPRPRGAGPGRVAEAATAARRRAKRGRPSRSASKVRIRCAWTRQRSS